MDICTGTAGPANSGRIRDGGFAGDESDEYSRNPDNFTIWSLNDICNLDATILGYAEAKEGSAFGRNAKGEWQRER